jgi:hypothetical protein
VVGEKIELKLLPKKLAATALGLLQTSLVVLIAKNLLMRQSRTLVGLTL